ncbi:MAG TPA: roadblock/LC7 domain-containing protein [Thermoplasmata archaeon]|nr:roadblock/LC7 domain-containing protein [Thermoplasmata archaeon]
MSDPVAIESILHEIEKDAGVDDVVLVSHSGAHIAGNVPQGAHSDTFVAMFAIILGAAETARSELKERLDSVVINMETSRLVIINHGSKALFVVRTPKDKDLVQLRQNLEKYARRIEEYL